MYLFLNIVNQNPLAEDYHLIDPNNPKTGLVVDFLPYVLTTTSNNLTIQNQYNFILQIQCSTTSSTNLNKCVNTQTTNSTTNITNTLSCVYQSAAGCPIIQTNDFWQFLVNNCIIFAIFLWALGIF